jgi:hypothetical protein
LPLTVVSEWDLVSGQVLRVQGAPASTAPAYSFCSG